MQYGQSILVMIMVVECSVGNKHKTLKLKHDWSTIMHDRVCICMLKLKGKDTLYVCSSFCLEEVETVA